jgi:rubrerythrin
MKNMKKNQHTSGTQIHLESLTDTPTYTEALLEIAKEKHEKTLKEIAKQEDKAQKENKRHNKVTRSGFKTSHIDLSS